MNKTKLTFALACAFIVALALNLTAAIQVQTEFTELVSELSYAPDQADIGQLNTTNWAAGDTMFVEAWSPGNTWDKLFNASALSNGFGPGSTGGDALWGAGVLFRDWTGVTVDGYLFFTGTTYRIDEIRIFGGHPNSGRGFINCDVAYSTGGAYIPIGKLQSGPFGVKAEDQAGDGSNVFCRLYDDGGVPLAAGVQSLRFTMHRTGDTVGGFQDDSAEGSIYREIDVIGAATVETSVTNVTEFTELVSELSFAPSQTDIGQLYATNCDAGNTMFVEAWSPGNTWDKLFNADANNEGFGPGSTGGDAIYGAGVLFRDWTGVTVDGYLFFTGTTFRINEIRIFAGHPNSGRGFINCDVAYSTGGAYIPIGKLQSGPFGVKAEDQPGNGSNIFCRLYDAGGAALATEVQSLRFTMHRTGDTVGGFQDDSAEASIYREIDVIGVVPEPFTFGLLALAGLFALRKRS